MRARLTESQQAAERAELTADDINWGTAPASGRDRSPAARLARAIEAGADEIEPGNRHLADVRAWLAADGDRGDVRLILADLALLDPLTFDEVRPAVAKAAGVRASTLDAEVAALRPQANVANDGHQGAALALTDPEPWTHRVDGAELLAELARIIARFVGLPEGAPTAIALWVLFAHAHGAATVSPLLGFVSPEKRCGKTTALALLSALVPRPLPASNISAAALFRAVEAFRPTLLVDEADTFLADRDELRGILNAGHTRATAYTVRCDGDEHEARIFSTWGPKAIALIGRLPDTLEDRAVVVSMRRRAPGEQIERLRLDRLGELEPLRRQAARWAADNMEALSVADPATPGGLHDRAGDNWRPLLAIADRAGGDWPERARKAAALLSGASDGDDGSVGTLLLADLRGIFDSRGAERLASVDIVASLVEFEDRPWPEWRRGEQLTARGLARLLGPFGVRPKQMKFDGQNVRGYEREWFEDAWSRYLHDGEDGPDDDSPPDDRGGASATPLQPAPSLDFGQTAPATGAEVVADVNRCKPAPTLEGNGVADRTPRVGQPTDAGDEVAL